MVGDINLQTPSDILADAYRRENNYEDKERTDNCS
jgi:hypothetical protein